MKTCKKCRQPKPLAEFYKRSDCRDGRNPWCRECYNSRQSAAYFSKYASKRARAIGMTMTSFQAMLKAQDGVCAICKETCPTQRRLSVDHDHKTGKIRGLLCARCNFGLGSFRDRPALLRGAEVYLSQNEDPHDRYLW